jgi:hypothetical protein
LVGGLFPTSHYALAGRQLCCHRGPLRGWGEHRMSLHSTQYINFLNLLSEFACSAVERKNGTIRNAIQYFSATKGHFRKPRKVTWSVGKNFSTLNQPCASEKMKYFGCNAQNCGKVMANLITLAHQIPFHLSICLILSAGSVQNVDFGRRGWRSVTSDRHEAGAVWIATGRFTLVPHTDATQQLRCSV